ncbi:hypothetical protein PAXINDRAFT_172910 [Paxillus involutus ATCC 200175]|uniref:Uncharacterized protein n=1 Tax=Paxillus involutus ATCC 200175 TaxID=664439 RepID=A0A0C9SNU5_PAXIN|nr:hypothetical protein PAXINDRAFT_172910 [Paxillus involutus ATCC 200175]
MSTDEGTILCPELLRDSEAAVTRLKVALRRRSPCMTTISSGDKVSTEGISTSCNEGCTDV